MPAPARALGTPLVELPELDLNHVPDEATRRAVQLLLNLFEHLLLEHLELPLNDNNAAELGAGGTLRQPRHSSPPAAAVPAVKLIEAATGGNLAPIEAADVPFCWPLCFRRDGTL